VCPSSEEFLWCDPELTQLLLGYSNILKQRKQQCADQADLLVEIQLIANRVVANAQPCCRKLPFPEFYTALLRDVREVGWDRLLKLDPSLSTLSIDVSDDSKTARSHMVEFKVPQDYPTVTPCHIADCPDQVDVGVAKSIAELVQKYVSELPRFRLFWEVMEDWDGHTWVLEPAHPTRACRFRRVVIGNNLSLHIEVDPAKPLEACDCSFFGADAAVSPLRARWFASKHLWNMGELPRLNLQRLLQLEFPPNTARSRDVFNLECGICYSYTPLEGEGIPDQMCENSRCGRGFHHACLLNWLRAVPVSRQSFQTLFGACPYCSEPISISVSGRPDD
jgi:E3 ubiquitin-protein ligase FANCL